MIRSACVLLATWALLALLVFLPASPTIARAGGDSVPLVCQSEKSDPVPIECNGPGGGGPGGGEQTLTSGDDDEVGDTIEEQDPNAAHWAEGLKQVLRSLLIFESWLCI